MKAKHIFFGLATLVLMTLTLSSCKKDSTTNSMGSASSSGVNLKINGANTVYNIPVPVGGPGTVTTTKPFVRWSTANLFISRITFEAELLTANQVGEPRDVEYSWPGPKLVDLLNPPPSLFNLPVPAGTYKELEFTVYANKSDAGSTPVFYLSGTYTNLAGTQIPIVIDITDDIVLRAQKDDATVRISVGTVGSLSGLIQVYLDRLFSSILPDNLNLVGVDTQIVISATSNPELYQLILQNLAKNGEIEFGRDT